MSSDQTVENVASHFSGQLRRAVLREQLLRLPDVTDAYRRMHADAEGCPGLIIDKIGSAIVAHCSSLGMLQQLEPLGEWLPVLDPPKWSAARTNSRPACNATPTSTAGLENIAQNGHHRLRVPHWRDGS